MKNALLFFLFVFGFSAPALAHGSHDETPVARLENIVLPAPKVNMTEEGGQRVIRSNGIPAHATGTFPGRGNPHAISAQDYTFRMPLVPQKSGSVTKVTNRMDFGVALSGVPFDPGTAEYWNRDRSSGWVEEGIVDGRKRLGIDQNNAHVQPNGAYHYHGIPNALVKTGLTHIGYAADGFKIYAAPADLYKSSYALKKGMRPGNGKTPDGRYDGTYTQDFEYVAGHGDLDQCNGMMKDGEYIYVLTHAFPFVPRCWFGTPDKSFHKTLGGGGMGRPDQRGGAGDGRRLPPGHRPPPRF